MYSSRISNKKIVLSILIIFVLGTICHFIYNLSGQFIVIGSLFPVNESIWEHLKLILIPMLLWWIVFYIRYGHKYNLNIDKWFLATLMALVSAIFLQLSIFYIYSGALGIESLIIDIIIFLLSIICGQYMGFHFYKYGNNHNYKISLLIILLIIIFFIIMTFNPPHLPIFLDLKNGTYGI